MVSHRKKKEREKQWKVAGKDVGDGFVVRFYHDSKYSYFALSRRQMKITDRFNVHLPKPMSHEEICARVYIAFKVLPNPINSKVNVNAIFELGVEEYEKRRKGN